MNISPLIERFPRLADICPPIRFGRFPTPVESLRIPEIEAEIYVKRDDQSADPYGGSKTRNLEWILGAARRVGATTLTTLATHGSHLVLALTVHGRREGFQIRPILIPQPPSAEVERVRQSVLEFGAEAEVCTSVLEVPGALMRRHRDMRRGRERGFHVASGGASALGTLGYFAAALELEEDVRRGLLVRPDYVYCAAGSSGTMIGLSEGFAFLGWPTRVVGIRVVPRLFLFPPREWCIRRGLREILAQAGVPPYGSARVLLEHSAYGGAYGRPWPPAEQIARDLQDHLPLDSTYTGKSMAGMLQFIRRHGLARKFHLFINTFDARIPVPQERNP